MKVQPCIALGVILLGALVPGSRLSADRLQPPPEPTASGNPKGNPEVHWIRKALTAPVPVPPTAPLPAPSSLPPVEQRIARSLSEEYTLPDDPPITLRESTGRRAESEVLPTPPPASVAEPGMTLAEAEKMALANNPTLVQAAMRIRAAQGKCVQAGLYPNPTVGYVGEEMGAEGTLGQQGAFVGQQFVTAGKLRLRSAVVGHEIVQADHAWQAQQARVLTDVRAAWYQVLVAQRIVELNDELVRIGRQGVKTAGDLLAAQEVSRADLLQARIEADSAGIRLFDAHSRHEAAWRRLAALLGVPDMKPSRLAGLPSVAVWNKPPPNGREGGPSQLTWQESLGRLLAESPELAEARAGVHRAEAAVTRECAERIPDVNVQAGVRYHLPAEDTVATIEVGLPLPIFNRNQGNISKAQAQLVAAQKEVQRIELALQERLAAAFRQYNSARYEAQQYAGEILPKAKATLDLVQAGYGQGEYDYLTLLTAQRTYFQVNLAHLESLLKYWSSSVAIEGFLLTGGLQNAAKPE